MSKGLSIPLCRLWAGLDCGVWAAVLFNAWLALHSIARGEFWWSKFNVAASVFFGDAVFRMGLGRATLAGLALLLIVYACLGMLFGLAASTRGFLRNLILAVLFALAWHLLAHRFFWRALSPFGPSYFPPYAVLVGHLFYALLLTRFARRFRALAREFGDPAWSLAFAEPPPDSKDSASAAPPPVELEAAVESPSAENPPEPSAPAGGEDAPTERPEA